MCRTGGWRSLPGGSPHPTHTALCQCWGAARNECMRMGWDGMGRDAAGAVITALLWGVTTPWACFWFCFFLFHFLVCCLGLLVAVVAAVVPLFGENRFVFVLFSFLLFFFFSFLSPFFLPEICTSARCVLGSVIKRSRCAAHTARCRRLPARPAPPLGRETKKKEKE